MVFNAAMYNKIKRDALRNGEDFSPEQVLGLVCYFPGKNLLNGTLDKLSYRPLFMPELVDLRLNSSKRYKELNEEYDNFGYSTALLEELKTASFHGWMWKTNIYSTASIVVTYKTKPTNLNGHGMPITLYVHTNNYFSNPKKISQAKKQGLVNGAAVMPEQEFYNLLSQEDNKAVFVVDTSIKENNRSGWFSCEGALNHTHIIPYLGGKDRAEAYLNHSRFGLRWINPELDFGDAPLARPLFLHSIDDANLYGNSLEESLGFGGIMRTIGIQDGLTICEFPTQKTLETVLEQAPLEKNPKKKGLFSIFSSSSL